MPEEVPQSLICCVWRGASRSSDIDHSITLSFNASNEFHSQTPSPPRSDNEPDSKVPIEKLPTTIFDAYTPLRCPSLPSALTCPQPLQSPVLLAPLLSLLYPPFLIPTLSLAAPAPLLLVRVSLSHCAGARGCGAGAREGVAIGQGIRERHHRTPISVAP